MTAAPQSFVLPAAADRGDMLARVMRFCHQLSVEKRWRVTIEPYVRRRSSSQNAYLWGVVYPTILAAGNLDGWTAEDLHEFFLMDHFGSEIIEGFDTRLHKPLRRSSGLTTVEFMGYTEHIQRFCAQRGIYVPDPNEEVEAA